MKHVLGALLGAVTLLGSPPTLSPPPLVSADSPPAYRSLHSCLTHPFFPFARPASFPLVGDSSGCPPLPALLTFFSLHPPQCFLQISSLTYFLHPSSRAGWVFGSIHHPGRFSPFPSRLPGFTRRRRRKVQFDLDILLLVVLEIHGLLAAPSRSGLWPSFPAWPIHCSTFRLWSASLALPTVMT
mgnify:CR=1 FL=1